MPHLRDGFIVAKVGIRATREPSSSHRSNPLNRYLDELIDYGGEPYTRAEAILDMQPNTTPQPCIDRWLQGHEHWVLGLSRIPVKPQTNLTHITSYTYGCPTLPPEMLYW